MWHFVRKSILVKHPSTFWKHCREIGITCSSILCSSVIFSLSLILVGEIFSSLYFVHWAIYHAVLSCGIVHCPAVVVLSEAPAYRFCDRKWGQRAKFVKILTHFISPTIPPPLATSIRSPVCTAMLYRVMKLFNFIKGSSAQARTAKEQCFPVRLFFITNKANKHFSIWSRDVLVYDH